MKNCGKKHQDEAAKFKFLQIEIE